MSADATGTDNAGRSVSGFLLMHVLFPRFLWIVSRARHKLLCVAAWPCHVRHARASRSHVEPKQGGTRSWPHRAWTSVEALSLSTVAEKGRP